MYDGMNLYRAVVSYSSATTGDIQVRIPAVLGTNEVISVSKIGRGDIDGVWQVPIVGSQVVVAVEDDRFSNIYMVYPNLALLQGTGDGGGEEPPPVVQFVPSGAIMQFAGASVPAGWLLCNGEPVSRTTYANLFAAIGTAYGVGNNTTTFNLPNLKGKIPVGMDVAVPIFNALNNTGGTTGVTLGVANLPQHNHGLNNHAHTLSHGHPLTGTGTHTHTGTTYNDGNHQHTFRDFPIDTQILQAGSTAYYRTGVNASTTGNASHTHTLDITSTNSGHSHTVGTADTTNTGQASGNTANTGSGTAIETMSPYIVVNYIIKV